MASKFMKIKRIIIPFMTLVVMTSQLAGCATMSSREMLETMQESPEVVIEYAIPDDGEQSLDASHVIDTDGQQEAVDSEANLDIGLIDNQGSQELQEISHDELIAVFEENYEISKNIYNSDDEEIIRSELEMIKMVVKNMDKALPSDYGAQYRAWRPSVNQQMQAPEATLTFTEVNEQVWATGTVNLRSGPSTEDEKVGALNKGNSVTRIGIGTGDYASWSKVKLSDGTEVYVASSYLTTTKPSSGGGSTAGTGKGGTGTQTQQPVQQDPPFEDRGTTTIDSSERIITDPNELATGIADSYDGYGEITIGYGN